MYQSDKSIETRTIPVNFSKIANAIIMKREITNATAQTHKKKERQKEKRKTVFLN